ncbi:MAG: SDR family oxidoreductase [Asticcacaulis sp.]|uniref:SDR family oxidoreductase n=1 Tax=Asticcacaulis sp. TaxID=1872648 RepID=UPI003F7BF6CC
MPKQANDLKRKTVVVTGASAGLGRAIAVAFAREGCHVGLIARSEEGLKSAAAEALAAGEGAVVWAVADTADPEALGKAAVDLEAQLGPIDIWVNNAMETIFSRVADITPDEFRRVTEVTYLGFVYGTMEALKRMIARGQGTIIQVGSALAYRSIPLQSAYCGAKAAIRGFTDSLRCELIHNHRGVKLSMVHMPAMNTPQFSWARTHVPHQPQPVGKIFQPEVGADAVVHAARYPKREYFVGASTIEAVLGTKVLPGFMDHKMAKMSYEGQYASPAPIPTRAGNLMTPAAAGLHTTHGQFDDKAVDHSTAWSLTKWLSRWI